MEMRHIIMNTNNTQRMVTKTTETKKDTEALVDKGLNTANNSTVADDPADVSEDLFDTASHGSESENYTPEIIEDLNMDSFFFTGVVEHSFRQGKLSFSMKVLNTKESEEAHRFLWQLTEQSISTNTARAAYSIFVLSRALTKFGDRSLADKSPEEIEAFVKSLPNVVIPLLNKKYESLEYTAAKFFEDENNLKN